MKYIELFEKEIRSEEEEDLYTIYLYHEGDWWRAYEWSAYLCEMFPNNLEKKDKLKPNKKTLKEHEEGLISVGLKLKSFDKYLPSATKEEVSDIIKINVKEFFADGFTINSYREILCEWKGTIPFKNEIKIKETISECSTPPFMEGTTNCKDNLSFMGIMGELLSYQIEEHSIKENTEFLYLLKKKLIKLFY